MIKILDIQEQGGEIMFLVAWTVTAILTNILKNTENCVVGIPFGAIFIFKKLELVSF